MTELVDTSVTAIAQVTYGTCMALAMPVWYAPMSFSDTQSMAWWLLPTIGASAVAAGRRMCIAESPLIRTRASHPVLWRGPHSTGHWPIPYRILVDCPVGGASSGAVRPLSAPATAWDNACYGGRE